MKTKIVKIKGKDKLTVEYKNQVFQVKCHPNDVKYFKYNIDIMIKKFITDFAIYTNINELSEADDQVTDYTIKAFLKK